MIKPLHEIEDTENFINNQINVLIINKYKDNKVQQNILTNFLKVFINILQSKYNYLLTSNHLTRINKYNNDNSLSGSQNNSILKANIQNTKAINVQFTSSKNAIISLVDVFPKEIKLHKIFQMINLAIVRAMIITNAKPSKIGEIIENDYFNTDYLSNSFFEHVTSFESKMALAHIYRKNGEYEKALNILKEFIPNASDVAVSKLSRDFAYEILTTNINEDQKYLKTFEEMLKVFIETKNHTQTLDIVISTGIISIDHFLENILADFDPSKNLRETYLTMLCSKKYNKYAGEKYETLIIDIYIDNLLNDLKKDFVASSVDDLKLPPKYSKLKESLRTYNSYNSLHLLERVKDTWMYDIELDLYRELKKYNEYLEKMIKLVKIKYKSFKDIEVFCKVNYSSDENIYKTYFKLLSKEYKENITKNNEILVTEFKNEMLNIISKFMKGELVDKKINNKNQSKLSLIEVLNPAEILDDIPDDWKISEQIVFDLMRYYLMEYENISQDYKRLGDLCRADLLEKQIKLFNIKERFIILDQNNSICCGCGKKLLLSSTFVAYPNGNLYHSYCVNSMQIEPKTGRNFSNYIG